MGSVEINGTQVDLDKALAYMQDGNNLPAWRQIDVTMPGGSWQPGSLLQLDAKPDVLTAKSWQFHLRSVNGQTLPGTLLATDYENSDIPVFLIIQSNTNSWVAISTGKSFEFRKLDPFFLKNLIVLGIKQEAAEAGMRYGLKGIGILVK